jgi:putative aldouronate transport system permease protein
MNMKKSSANKKWNFREALARFDRNKAFLLMALPGTIWLLIFCYLPMGGVFIAFKKMTFFKSSFIENILISEWVGFQNFEFFFGSPDAWRVTRNTILYNLVFIAVGLIVAVTIAIAANELHSKRASKYFQSVMILPAFLSWVAVSYLVYSFLNPGFGVINNLLSLLGIAPVDWYKTEQYWPFIFLFLNIWKGAGMGSIYYFAALTGIDQEMYQAAQLDGASKWKQTIHVTIPSLRSTMIILTILSLGNVVRSDFGLFWVTSSNLGGGALFNVGSTIDTYIYKALISNGNISLAAASGLYQSVVGFATIVSANLIIRKIEPESAMF